MKPPFTADQVEASLGRLDEREPTAVDIRTMPPRRSGRRSARGRGGGLGVALALVGIASLLAACSSSSSSSTTTTKAPTTTTSGVKAVPGPSSGTIPLYEVSTGTVSGLGTVLVAGNGFTLYMFVPDKDSGVSTCYSACAEAWPPLLLTGAITPVYGHGVNPNLIGTTKRTDGTVQVTYKGWPLYLWAGDSEPGQATGQAINNHGGLWYVLNPAGKVVTKKVSQ
jgi:predicted lipoprotein with Yx(FWY)xxD motif